MADRQAGVRVTVTRKLGTDPDGRTVFSRTIVREFADPAEAARWFVEDSYFAEPYTISATWERVYPK